MITTFDKAIAGGLSAWLTSGIVAMLAAAFHLATPVDPQVVTTIQMIVGAIVVYLIPNKTVATAK